MRLYVLAVSLLVFLNTALYAQGQVARDSALPSILETDLLKQPAPQFEATTLDGKMFSLADLDGRVFMIHFWSLNCAACFQELVDLNKLLILYREFDFTIISVMDNSREELLKRFAFAPKGYRIKKPVFGNDSINFQIVPEGMDILEAYHMPKSFPRSFIVDKKGIITFHKLGYGARHGIPGEITSMDFFQDHLDSLFGINKVKRLQRNKTVRELREGDQIPFFAATGIDEKLLSITDLYDRELCIQFYSPDAGLDVIEVNSFIDKHQDSETLFLNICLNSDWDSWTNFVETNGLQGTNLLAEGNWGKKIVKEYNLSELPGWIVVDKGNVLKQKHTDLNHLVIK